MALATRDLSVSYGKTPVLDSLDLAIPPGKISALVGANGCGKSTLLKALARLIQPAQGAVFLDEVPLVQMSTKAVARAIAILPQSPDAPPGLLVRELVGYGRYPWQKGFAAESADDRRAIAEALEQTSLLDLADRPIGTLSGGQRQRAWIAMALAQNSRILLLDEPTTFLDMGHQLEVLSLLSALNREAGKTIVMVVHDLNHALRYAHHLVAIADGHIIAEGPPELAINHAVLKEVFGVAADLIDDPRSGKRICVPYATLA